MNFKHKTVTSKIRSPLNAGTTDTSRGFTLIELMVAVTLFSIVMVIAMGAIFTVLDANRKARTLTEVMNNLNFSLESITRSIKTGVQPSYNSGTGILCVTAIDLESDVTGFNRELIEYRRDEDSDGRGFLERRVSNGSYTCSGGGSGQWLPITSEILDIKNFQVTVAGLLDFNQPRTQLTLEGEVKINEKINSSFSIQTTVSQRKLNLQGDE